MDLLLGRFASEYLDFMTDEEMATYSVFLDQQDHDIYDWVMNNTAPTKFQNIIERIRVYTL